jgi:hypothetical protein
MSERLTMVMPPPVQEIRDHVLRAHALLRARSAELASNALRIARGVEEHHVRRLVVDLWSIVAETDDLEERELVPLLVRADAWGTARVERLRERHVRHERELGAIADELSADVSVATVITQIESAIANLLEDLEDEEAISLEPGLLDDDPINTQEFGG